MQLRLEPQNYSLTGRPTNLANSMNPFLDVCVCLVMGKAERSLDYRTYIGRIKWHRGLSICHVWLELQHIWRVWSSVLQTNKNIQTNSCKTSRQQSCAAALVRLLRFAFGIPSACSVTKEALSAFIIMGYSIDFIISGYDYLLSFLSLLLVTYTICGNSPIVLILIS